MLRKKQQSVRLQAARFRAAELQRSPAVMILVLNRFKDWLLRNRKKPALAEWYFVSFDETSIITKATPAGKESWEQSFRWDSIIRVCFKDEGIFASDGLYIFTSERPEAFVIPTEASGGEKLFGALAERGFFPEEIWRKAVASTDGGVYCWPPKQ